MVSHHSLRSQFIAALGLSTLVSIGFFVYGAWLDKSIYYDYLIWNLFLAWLPLLFAYRLVIILQRKLWSSWEAMGVSVLWIVFLPNSFYMISDFIHLQDIQYHLLYDALMFTSFIYIGVLLGFSSLYLVHLEMSKRFTRTTTWWMISITLLICSFAIYLGRDLRWNSWDILTNPGGLLFDISVRVLHPAAYPEMILTIVPFFILLLSMYLLVWNSIRLIRFANRRV